MKEMTVREGRRRRAGRKITYRGRERKGKRSNGGETTRNERINYKKEIQKHRETVKKRR